MIPASRSDIPDLLAHIDEQAARIAELEAKLAEGRVHVRALLELGSVSV